MCRRFTLILFPMTEPGDNPGEEEADRSEELSAFEIRADRLDNRHGKGDSTAVVTFVPPSASYAGFAISCRASQEVPELRLRSENSGAIFRQVVLCAACFGRLG